MRSTPCYQLSSTSFNDFRTSDFRNELDCYFLDDILLLSGKVLLVCDMNVHWDRPDKPDIEQFAGIISAHLFSKFCVACKFANA